MINFFGYQEFPHCVKKLWNENNYCKFDFTKAFVSSSINIRQSIFKPTIRSFTVD
jgi:hypothetical protein